ncbi:hypothetical protein AVEN_138790-1 [Araneus ventricosus]|uniref:Uncharacterized protein n=1 Tax=Araneus ventricosus TaxID=182803 RepID=A0A4Y2M4T8_ARAVE|nr:hypothetical protein AVEN_138790-1 [Araneus ventricosus]
MEPSSLYETCLKRVAVLLKNGIWRSRRENPFRFMPSTVVDDLVSAMLLLHGPFGFRAADLELLLTSGRLRELKMNAMNVQQELGTALKSLSSACQELKVLHLLRVVSEDPGLSEAIEELLRNSPRLEDVFCCIPFDLTALRKCRELRKMKLSFPPQQRWCDFLERENSSFKPLKYLEVFSIFSTFLPSPCDDMVIILKHCPALTSLGLIESSEALAHLHRTGVSPSELKLRRCLWGIRNKNVINSTLIRDAVLQCPKIEELHFLVNSVESVRYLRDLRNLTFLDIMRNISDKGELGALVISVMETIGRQLKHLSLRFHSRMDISVLLEHCPNLESLQIHGGEFVKFSKAFVSLSNLKRLTLKDNNIGDEKLVLPLLSNCNQITDLFVKDCTAFDDETLKKFLQRNSLTNLKIAYLKNCSLTQHGFKKFLLSASHLEKVEIISRSLHTRGVKQVLRETNHKVVCNKQPELWMDEFFMKKFK